MPILCIVASALLGSSPVVAATPNRCVSNGAVTYQQGPCPTGEARKPPTVDELNAARKYQPARVPPAPSASATPLWPRDVRCDGRKHCSEMRSCEEAKYFLAHCPAVEMDGDKNGIPCERQWCVR